MYDDSAFTSTMRDKFQSNSMSSFFPVPRIYKEVLNLPCICLQCCRFSLWSTGELNAQKCPRLDSERNLVDPCTCSRTYRVRADRNFELRIKMFLIDSDNWSDNNGNSMTDNGILSSIDITRDIISSRGTEYLYKWNARRGRQEGQRVTTQAVKKERNALYNKYDYERFLIFFL